MPACNAEAYIEEAIRSVLSQDYARLELVVVDDCSSDRTAELVRSLAMEDPRVRLLRNAERLGSTKSRNRAFAAADTQARYIAVMDADDACEHDRLSAQVAFLEAHPDIAVVGGHIRFIDEHSKVIGERRYLSEPRSVALMQWIENPFAHPATTIRASVLREIGGYDESRQRLDDYELWMRLLARHQGANLDQFVLRYRISTTQSKAKNTRAILKHTMLLKYQRIPPSILLHPRVLARFAGEALLYALPSRVVLTLFRSRHGIRNHGS